MDGVNTFDCMCDPGYTGEVCQTNIDDCVGVNCSGNGECMDGVNTFTCECRPGFIGLLCTEGMYVRLIVCILTNIMQLHVKVHIHFSVDKSRSNIN